ncbi:hypothetical protein NL676_024620 [Syzygium grande]|nr:hypothetical protein NL676_024620 [Syzygium grande]
MNGATDPPDTSTPMSSESGGKGPWPGLNDLMWSLSDLLCLKSELQTQSQRFLQFFSWVLQSPLMARGLPHLRHAKGFNLCFRLKCVWRVRKSLSVLALGW